jgi:hypothetical protein
MVCLVKDHEEPFAGRMKKGHQLRMLDAMCLGERLEGANHNIVGGFDLVDATMAGCARDDPHAQFGFRLADLSNLMLKAFQCLFKQVMCVRQPKDFVALGKRAGAQKAQRGEGLAAASG